ncbi:bifunctional metallophosphatase/5'-nucleotidase [Nitrincola iocasae]|uniref:Bifunctional metallophosphatase/5'-nucleotidase n=1 Tax=Nitrincola iocasae TaxID=2614693 RepID=A0A5J6LHK2_9GAMM|nr:5'-nucleotidase C-terminal domain-containing protein [Nitrincola iocasae]QEW07968.1 bifunctional metallophosphatase/5'-nucleotidase [Nitrincola iocasae]
MLSNISVLCQRLSACIIVAVLLLPTSLVAQDNHLRLVYVSEMTEMDSEEKGSYPRLAGLLNHYRAEPVPVLFISGGGGLAPSAMSSLDRGAHIIDLLNSLEPVAMVAGKREFSFGEDELSLRAYEAAFPVIASNLYDPLTGNNLDGISNSLLVQQYGITLGFIAVIPPITHEEYNLQRVEVLDPVQSIITRAEQLRAAGADRIILTYSCCYRDYLDYFTELDQLLHDGVIDLALGKDEHLLLAENRLDSMHPNHIWVTEGDQVAVVDLNLAAASGESMLLEWHAESMNGYEPDSYVTQQVGDYHQRLELLLNEEIGQVMTSFATYQADVRTAENPLGNLLADVIRAHAGADIGLINGGFIRGERRYEVGDRLTRRDIMREVPFRDRIVLIDVSGATLLAALENGFSQVEEIKGRFPHVSGMQVTYDFSRPVGQRVQQVNIAGQPLAINQQYRLATREFLATGGDGFEMFIDQPHLRYSGQMTRLVADILMDHVQETHKLAPTVEGRLVDVQ